MPILILRYIILLREENTFLPFIVEVLSYVLWYQPVVHFKLQSHRQVCKKDHAKASLACCYHVRTFGSCHFIITSLCQSNAKMSTRIFHSHSSL